MYQDARRGVAGIGRIHEHLEVSKFQASTFVLQAVYQTNQETRRLSSRTTNSHSSPWRRSRSLLTKYPLVFSDNLCYIFPRYFKISAVILKIGIENKSRRGCDHLRPRRSKGAGI